MPSYTWAGHAVMVKLLASEHLPAKWHLRASDITRHPIIARSPLLMRLFPIGNLRDAGGISVRLVMDIMSLARKALFADNF
jgi:hypothetical protein